MPQKVNIYIDIYIYVGDVEIKFKPNSSEMALYRRQPACIFVPRHQSPRAVN